MQSKSSKNIRDKFQTGGGGGGVGAPPRDSSLLMERVIWNPCLSISGFFFWTKLVSAAILDHRIRDLTHH